MTPEISIIVPVYNVEKYLRRCVDSILAQTFRNFECILIDDGSPDNCPAICDEYAAKDPRIQVIHQKNAGVSAARNAGLAAARGNWIGFVDSDDWIEPDTYATAYNAAKEKNADLVQWNITREKRKKRIERIFDLKEGYFSVADDARYFCPSVWHKLILRKLICANNITFPMRISYAEDELFVFQCYVSAVHCYQLENALYHYEQREDSCINTITREKIFEHVHVLKIEQDIILLKNLEKSEWRKVVLEKKKAIKGLSIFSLENPDFNLYRSLFQECNKEMTKVKGKRRPVYLLLYFHLDFMATIVFRMWRMINRKYFFIYKQKLQKLNNIYADVKRFFI